MAEGSQSQNDISSNANEKNIVHHHGSILKTVAGLLSDEVHEQMSKSECVIDQNTTVHKCEFNKYGYGIKDEDLERIRKHNEELRKTVSKQDIFDCNYKPAIAAEAKRIQTDMATIGFVSPKLDLELPKLSEALEQVMEAFKTSDTRP